MSPGYKSLVYLHVTVFRDKDKEHDVISGLVTSAMTSHPWLQIRIRYADEVFNRGKGEITAKSQLNA